MGSHAGDLQGAKGGNCERKSPEYCSQPEAENAPRSTVNTSSATPGKCVESGLDCGAKVNRNMAMHDLFAELLRRLPAALGR